MKAIKEHIIRAISKLTDIAVIGLSGGADSLLVTLLCMEALSKKKVYTYSLPYGDYDLKSFNRQSIQYADHLGVQHQSIVIGASTDALNHAIQKGLGTAPLSLINAGNGRARIRMAVLYGAAHHLAGQLNARVRVIGTGNLSEDFIGYDTKGGDALADFFPIGDLFKSEVYKMLEYYQAQGYITPAMINRKPSAGLWEDQTDEDEIGYSYKQMEPSIRYLLKHYDRVEVNQLSPKTKFVWDRHCANQHKHLAPHVIKVRGVLP